jgi:thioester reductase-like protein
VGDEIERINVGAPEHAVRMCLSRHARLIHVSTTSVAGMGEAGQDNVLTEQCLYFGQRLEEQKYLNSKFLAERMILSAMAGRGLDAKIMRVGNLMARHADGEFQINFNTNSFVGLLRGYCRLGLIPWDAQAAGAELSPIDLTARAILKLARTPRECCVFHPYDDHGVLTVDVIDALNRRGLDIRPCETEEFAEALAKGLKDPDKNRDLGVLIAYAGEGGEDAVMLRSGNAYTSQALHRLGFRWPLITEGYLDRLIDGLKTLGFFD